MEKHLIVFLFTKFKAKKQNNNDPHKKVKSKQEPSSFAFPSTLLKQSPKQQNGRDIAPLSVSRP